MKNSTLGYINTALQDAGIPYQYGTYNIGAKDKTPVQWWVGSYRENETLSEDGYEESIFTLDGNGRGSMLDLEQSKQTIKSLFPSIEGNRAILSDGTAIAIFYANAIQVPTDDMAMKRLQINLTVKEWVNE